jgi:hypothetical protein
MTLQSESQLMVQQARQALLIPNKNWVCVHVLGDALDGALVPNM